MKVMGAIAAYYGKEYIGYAVKSLYDSVDKIHIFYTETPSFGHRTDQPCPESYEELVKASKQFGDPENKIIWHKGYYQTEGDHRRTYENFAESMGFDIVVVCDTDEVYDKESLDEAITFVAASTKKRFRVPMIHMWQGFTKVCKDLAQPVRFYKVNGDGEDYVPMKKPVWHFGYAIGDELMDFKWKIHGHKDELRSSWMEDKWLARAVEDVHPTNLNFWNAEDYDKTQLPEFMQDHPRWND